MREHEAHVPSLHTINTKENLDHTACPTVNEMETTCHIIQKYLGDHTSFNRRTSECGNVQAEAEDAQEMCHITHSKWKWAVRMRYVI